MIIGGGVIGAILLIAIVLYFFGVFDEEPVKAESVNKQKTETKVPAVQTPEIPKKPTYKFKVKDINKKRLNKKLSILTKDEIIEEKKAVEVPNKQMIENQEMQAKLDEKIQASKIKAENTIQPDSEEKVEKKLQEKPLEMKTESKNKQEEIVVVKKEIAEKTTPSTPSETTEETKTAEKTTVEPIIDDSMKVSEEKVQTEVSKKEEITVEQEEKVTTKSDEKIDVIEEIIEKEETITEEKKSQVIKLDEIINNGPEQSRAAFAALLRGCSLPYRRIFYKYSRISD